MLVSGHSGIIARMEGRPGDKASTLLPFVAHTVYVLRQCKRLIYRYNEFQCGIYSVEN